MSGRLTEAQADALSQIPRVGASLWFGDTRALNALVRKGLVRTVGAARDKWYALTDAGQKVRGSL